MHVGNLESGIRNQEFGALESGIQFKESDIEVPLTKIWNPVLGIPNSLCGIQHQRLSWIPALHGAITQTGLSFASFIALIQSPASTVKMLIYMTDTVN